MSPEGEAEKGKENQQVKPDQGKGKAGGFREALGAPARFSVADLLKAIRVVSDKGGHALVKDVIEIFGGTKKREILGRSLGFAEVLGFLEMDGKEYVVNDEGKTLLASNEDDKRGLLAAKLVQFEPYRVVFLRLRDEKGQGLKKEIITEMWSNVAGGGGKRIRQQMSGTFASLTSYAGLISDSGRTCTLQPVALPLLDGATPTHPSVGDKGSPKPAHPTVPMIGFEDIVCPRCNGKEFGVADEQLVNHFVGDGQTILFVKYTFHCRTCKESFSRHGQRTVAGAPSG